MTVQPAPRMTVDEFLAWAEGRPGRYELIDGIVHAMTPQRAAHAEAKFAVQTALAAGIRQRGLACHMLPDGMAVRIDETTVHEPDALVYCGNKLPSGAIEVPSPVIVVEVLSPSTSHVDASIKLAGYFRLPSLAHYVLVDPDKPVIIHHQRGSDEAIITHIVREGSMALDPPGLTLALADIYGPAAI